MHFYLKPIFNSKNGAKMKNCIITPTFKGHFPYLKQLLISYRKNVKDFNKFDYIVIASDKNEVEILKKDLIDFIDEKWLKLYDIESILEQYNIHTTSEDLLKKIGKFSYQTIKKLYPMHFFRYEYYFCIDSESLFLKKMNLTKIFDNFIKNKYLFYSSMNIHNMDNYKNWLDYKTSKHCSELLNIPLDNHWYFETFDWIYEKKIINDLFFHFSNNLYQEIINFSTSQDNDFDKAIFEIILYRQFISSHLKEYGYSLIDIVSELKDRLGKHKIDVMAQRLNQKNQEILPWFIHGWEVLNIRDIKIWGRLYKKYKLFSARLWLVNHKPRQIIRYYFIKQTGIQIACATDEINGKEEWSILKKFLLEIRSHLALFSNRLNRKK